MGLEKEKGTPSVVVDERGKRSGGVCGGGGGEGECVSEEFECKDAGESACAAAARQAATSPTLLRGLAAALAREAAATTVVAAVVGAAARKPVTGYGLALGPALRMLRPGVLLLLVLVLVLDVVRADVGGAASSRESLACSSPLV